MSSPPLSISAPTSQAYRSRNVRSMMMMPPPPASPGAAAAHNSHAITGYTSMGSPIYGTRARSGSLGTGPHATNSTPLGWHYHNSRSVPVSPLDSSSPATTLVPMSAPLLPGSQLSSSWIPPEPTAAQRARETVLAREGQRRTELEMHEAGASADELRDILHRERIVAGRLAADVAALKATTVQSQLAAEVLEEGRINGLMRRLDHLQQEKGRIMLELEREEEMLTNTLQKKLDQVRREKKALEQQIDKEKHANQRLRAQLADMRSNAHLPMAAALEEQEEMEEE